MPLFSYHLSGTIEVPEGSKLSDTGTGIVLPSGDTLRLWEQLELTNSEKDEYRNLTYDELDRMGIFYDGEMCEFEQSYGAEDLAKLNDQLAPANSDKWRGPIDG